MVSRRKKIRTIHEVFGKPPPPMSWKEQRQQNRELKTKKQAKEKDKE